MKFGRSLALVLLLAMSAVALQAAQRGFLDERLACIGPRDNCRFGELFKLENPLEPTADTAVAVTMRSSVSGHVIFFWHWDGTDCAETGQNAVEFDVEGSGRGHRLSVNAWQYPRHSGWMSHGRDDFFSCAN